MFQVCVDHTLSYHITVLLGMAAALCLGWRRCRAAGVPARTVASATVLLPLLGGLIARLGYCLIRAESLAEPFAFFFAFWQKGYMLYGGVAGCLLALALSGGKAFFGKLADAYAPSGALMIAAARLAEGFSGQGYGEYCFEECALSRFPFMVYDPYNELWAWALFMLEALAALAILGVLLAQRPRRSADRALLFLGLFASAQIVLESLRRDDFLRWGFVRCSEAFSAVTVAAVLFCYHRRAVGAGRAAKLFCWALCAAMLTLCVLLEFATEGRVPFLLFLDANGCYACMAGACLVLMGCVLWMRGLGGRAPFIAEKQEKEGLAS